MCESGGGGGGGHWPRKWVWGCAALKTPFSRLSCSSQGSRFKHKCQFTRPPFEKIWKFLPYSLNFCPNFSSQAPKSWNFQLTSPQIWKFLVHKPHFSEANISSQAPHFENPGRTPLPEKSWVPPSPPVWIYEATLYIAVAYIFLCKLNYGYHNQAHFHWYLPNGTLFSHKFCHWLWEKWELSSDTKISKSLKKVEQIGMESFK